MCYLGTPATVLHCFNKWYALYQTNYLIIIVFMLMLIDQTFQGTFICLLDIMYEGGDGKWSEQTVLFTWHLVVSINWVDGNICSNKQQFLSLIIIFLIEIANISRTKYVS